MSASKNKKNNKNTQKLNNEAQKNISKDVAEEPKLEEPKKEEKQQKNNSETKQKEEKKKVEKKVEEPKENKKEEKKEETQKEGITEKVPEKESTELTKIEEKPDYVNEMIKNKKRKTIIFICIVVIIIMAMLFSTIFALLNINNHNLLKGIVIKDVDVSNMSIEDAKNKISEVVEAELLLELQLKYGEDYQVDLNPEQIEFVYNIEDAVNEAYSIGRNGNILENNYRILLTTLLGKEIKVNYSYNEEFLKNIIDDINSKIPGLVQNPTYYIEDANLIINKGQDGIEVEKEELEQKIIDTILSVKIENTEVQKNIKEIDIPVKEVKAENINIDNIYSEVRCDPQDAYFETDPYQIYPDVDGYDFKLEEARENILSEDKEEYTIPLIITKASKTVDDLGTEAFPYMISSFSTKYDASNRNRSTNLEIAAKKINGKVLMPGDVFSYNKVVGKRTVEEGYKDAKIYADGGVVDGLAGGICQISSTLYNAVLLANLEIVERRNHSYTTSYVAAGKDATVVYGAIDFQFKNSRSYPIKIEASVKNGIAEFKIHGMQEENEYEIKIIPVTTGSIPFTTAYVQDPTLAPGQQVVTQVGHAGYKVTTYIEKRLNGQVVSKEVLSNDTYSPMKTIINIGPGVPVQ